MGIRIVLLNWTCLPTIFVKLKSFPYLKILPWFSCCSQAMNNAIKGLGFRPPHNAVQLVTNPTLTIPNACVNFMSSKMLFGILEKQFHAFVLPT